MWLKDNRLNEIELEHLREAFNSEDTEGEGCLTTVLRAFLFGAMIVLVLTA